MSLQAIIPIPGNGSDELCVGQVYILSILNTNEVLTDVDRRHVKLRRFENSRNQRWRLDPHIENRHTFVNVETGYFLCVEPGFDFLNQNYIAFREPEEFTFIPQKTGGYRVYNHNGNRPRLVTREGNDDFLQTTRIGDDFAIIGVHCAE